MRRCGSTTEVVLHIGHRRRRRVIDVVVRMRVVVAVPSHGLRAHTRRTTKRQRRVRRRRLVCACFELGEGVPPLALQLDARKRSLGAHGSEFSLRAGAPVLEARLELRAGPPAVENDRSARRWRDPRTLLRVGRLGVQVRAVKVLLVDSRVYSCSSSRSSHSACDRRVDARGAGRVCEDVAACDPRGAEAADDRERSRSPR